MKHHTSAGSTRAAWIHRLIVSLGYVYHAHGTRPHIIPMQIVPLPLLHNPSMPRHGFSKAQP